MSNGERRRWERRRAGWGVCVAVIGLVVAHAAVAAATDVLDDFEELSGWSVQTSPGASLEIAHDAGATGMGLRLDFDFHGGGGYVIARKAFALSLPENYAFTLKVRGDAPRNNAEFKLIDRSGRNVWWNQRRNFEFPHEWQEIAIKKRRIEFAWGPAGGGAPQRIAYLEFALVAGEGGKGSVWIDDLRLEEREPTARPDAVPKVHASTSQAGFPPEHTVDAEPATSWHSGALAADQWLAIDFVKPREYGGLVIDWDRRDYAIAYRVEASDDGEHWTMVYHCANGNGGRDYVYLPDGESRYIRLAFEESSLGQGYGIRHLAVKPFEFSATPNHFFQGMARDFPEGTFPKYFYSKQTYWTIVGVSGDGKQALINEEGMVEVDRDAFSIEPYLYADGQLLTWHSVQTAQELERGYLPIPSVIWQNDRIRMRITALAAGPAGASVLYVRYHVDNISPTHLAGDLFLAVRPFQVSPPWQSLNMVGGVTPINDIVFEGRTVRVNNSKTVISLTPPDHSGAATFDEAPVLNFLVEDRVPFRPQVSDPFGYASGALQYRLSIPSGRHTDIFLVVPFYPGGPTAENLPGPDGAEALFTQQMEAVVREWETTLGHVGFSLPVDAESLLGTVKSTVAYILMNRDGPAIHPGPRNYARSWIRDGALTSSALLQMGCTQEVRDFLRWFAAYQFADGKVPCCVDRRGADTVPEHDSNGEFVFAVAEYYRFTRDIGFLSELWSTVVNATDYLGSLRQQRLTKPYTHGAKQAFYGLLPESISHEGYSAHPVHSYWDDFFALRGFKDAAGLAAAMGDDRATQRFTALRDDFRRDLYASIARTMTNHRIDFLPASADLGDFDPTSTAIAVAPGNELHNLPLAAVLRTFDLYHEHVAQRNQIGPKGDDAYTPYELRNVEVFVRLGQRHRAWELLEGMMSGRRPAAWNQWAEVVWREPDMPRFIGDMPHTWVASSLIRSVRSMFVFEREADQSLVLAGGVPDAWVHNGGLTVKRLATHYGPLTMSLAETEPNRLRLRVAGDLVVPPGGFVLRPPLPGPLKAVTVNGEPVATFLPEAVTVRSFPADVLLEY